MTRTFSTLHTVLSVTASLLMAHSLATAQTKPQIKPQPQAQTQLLTVDLPVPFYTPTDFIQGLYRYGYPVRVATFSAQAEAQVSALNRLCSATSATRTNALQAAQKQWRATAAAWDELSAVAIGPLLQRRSQRQIDFSPTRPELIKRAIVSEPADTLAMERIGTPAKGLPALEWLLWSRPSPDTLPGSPACRYAQQVALEIQTEAAGLSHDFEALAAPNAFADRDTVTLAMNELVNQWIGGLERLRWAQMEKPLHSARSAEDGKDGKAGTPAFPRMASSSSAQTWAAEWKGITWLMLAPQTLPPKPGTGLVTLETYLRGRGLEPLANKLVTLAQQVQQTLPAKAPGAGAAGKTELLAATRALAALKRFAEAEMAPALDVNIGFSDADGD